MVKEIARRQPLRAGTGSSGKAQAATYLGLGITCLGQAEVSDDVIEDFLALSSNEESVICGFAIGHPQR